MVKVCVSVSACCGMDPNRIFSIRLIGIGVNDVLVQLFVK